MDGREIASRYISPGGRLDSYGKREAADDLMVAAGFLVWAEADGAEFGGHSAAEAFRAMCRMLDLDAIRLRKIMKGECE